MLGMRNIQLEGKTELKLAHEMVPELAHKLEKMLALRLGCGKEKH